MFLCLHNIDLIQLTWWYLHELFYPCFAALEKLLKDFVGKYATGEEVYMVYFRVLCPLHFLTVQIVVHFWWELNLLRLVPQLEDALPFYKNGLYRNLIS